MKINLHPEVVKLLKEQGHDLEGRSLEDLVNTIAFVYANGDFIRKADVAKRFVLDKVYRKSAEHMTPVFDEATHEFQGMAVVGKTESETIWVPSTELHDMIRDNTEILVMKSPRRRGIRKRKGKPIEAQRLSRDEFI